MFVGSLMGIPEIIQSGATGRIVKTSDGGQLADAIEATLTEQEATLRMAENGRRLVEQHHGLEHMLNRLEEIYANHLVASSH